MSEFHVIIPARYHSTRLKAKALADIGGKPMVVHVCERAAKSGAASVTVATDNQLIVDAVSRHGFNAVLTSDSHPSGSDRVYQAAEILELADEQIIVNVQGDEPFIPPENIALVASLIETSQAPMSTLCCEITEASEVLDPNAVKVIFNAKNSAIYFSRSVIPYSRDQMVELGKALPRQYYRHIGIYAYKKSFLKTYISWPPSSLETCESLEQLRVIENGFPIQLACLNQAPPHGVDTSADLEKAQTYWLSLS